MIGGVSRAIAMRPLLRRPAWRTACVTVTVSAALGGLQVNSPQPAPAGVSLTGVQSTQYGATRSGLAVR